MWGWRGPPSALRAVADEGGLPPSSTIAPVPRKGLKRECGEEGLALPNPQLSLQL